MYSHMPKRKKAMPTTGIAIAFFSNVCCTFFVRETPTSYMQKPVWMKNMRTTVIQ